MNQKLKFGMIVYIPKTLNMIEW